MYVVEVRAVGAVSCVALMSDGSVRRVPPALSFVGREVPDGAGAVVSSVPASRAPADSSARRESFALHPGARRRKGWYSSAAVSPCPMDEAAAENSYQLVRACVIQCRPNFEATSRDVIDDLTGEVFLHLFERSYFSRWDSKLGTYSSYVFRAVKNYIISHSKSVPERRRRLEVSLDAPVPGSGSPAPLSDVTPDAVHPDPSQAVLCLDVVAALIRVSRSLDSGAVHDGLPSYTAIARSLVDGLWPRLLNCAEGRRRGTLRSKAQALRDRAREVILQGGAA